VWQNAFSGGFEMKVESVKIRNFKRFESLEVAVKHKTLQEVSNRFLVLGDNGTGKTTFLQAIALPLALATLQIPAVPDFDWIGFVPGRFWRWGRPYVELEISFTDAEIDTTREAAEKWYEAQSEDIKSDRPFIKPGTSRMVRLILDGDSCRVAGGNRAELLQFRGRHYAYRLLKTNPSARGLFARLPGLFWFDQYRNLGSSLTEINGDGRALTGARISYDVGIERLRKYLTGWKLAQQSRDQPYRIDYLLELENLYKRIFQGRSFAGVEPMPGVDSPTAEDYYFLLNDGHRTYDIVEMSAGEQSVFPITYEFVRMSIAYSIVLIDEIDLNLHPPVAQAFVNQLSKIGPTCQFIFTTHSDAVSDVVGDDETYRLPGGSLCL
jgi:AAA domain, putative AbiEii toxin, Type IV TA system/AAA ATPase domain